MQSKSGADYGRLLSGFFSRSASWLAWLMAAFLGLYVIGLLIPDDGFNPLVDGWLASILKLSTVAVCWAAVLRKRARSRARVGASGLARFRHPELLLTAAAVSVIAMADSYSLGTRIWRGATSAPPLSEAGYLLFFAIMLAVLVILVRRQMRGLVWSVVLD
ncbi:MAG TPA: hypothetical protein VLO00_01540, partial [Cryobacterium sp.]|nr:hypothetical protein [Cryobacterium sp.]